MNELLLKYGCNPNQVPSKIFMKNGKDLPIKVLNGRPGYINFLDAFNSYQLVKELKEATGLPAAASFKHVSPAGAAVYKELSDTMKKIYFVEDLELSPMATAYARARGADRMSSYGDFIALSDTCDVQTAKLIAREVSDGIIAPSYTDEALEVLKTKRKGNYTVIEIDENYVPEEIEHNDCYGITFEQGRNNLKIDKSMLEEIVTKNKDIPESAKIDLLIALITLKYTQSNSVCYAKDGQAIGIGAGQQSRVHCTRLAGNKADNWYLRQHPKVLNLPFREDIRRPDRDNTIDVYISDFSEDVLNDGEWENFFTVKPEPLTAQEKKEWLKTLTDVALGSDAFFPFGDNIHRASKTGVKYVAQPGGSIRDDNVIETCDKYNMAMAFTKIRLFHH
ncbi:MAG: phosphoribosylaminoimidazolecarboxamide formyltransferase [Clostridia bacterium]|nr:phosphoribosylaminoimidazolecarboxamide formyltransferase [Clostridia bacterium]